MIKRALYALILITAATMLVGCATGKVKGEAKKASITAVKAEDNYLELKIDGQFTYTVYKSSDPFTAIVELPGVDMGGISDSIMTDKAGITEVKLSKTEKPSLLTKVEISLDSPSAVLPEYTGQSLILRVQKEEPQAEDKAAEAPQALAIVKDVPTEEPAVPEEAVEEALAEPLSPASEINSVDFELVNGDLRVNVKGDGSMEPNVFTLKNRIVMDVPNVKMKASLPEEVVAPVKAVRFGMHKDRVRIVFDMQEEAKFTTELVGNKVVLAFPLAAGIASADAAKPAAPAEPAEAEEKAPAVEKPEASAEAPEAAAEAEAAPEKKNDEADKIISLDFQNADIVPIFRFLGDVSGYNVVIHPQVSGKITLKLMNVPWDQALEIVLEIAGFEKKIDRENKIITIASSETFIKLTQEKEKLKAEKQKAADTMQEILILQYIEASDMKTRIDEAKVKNCTNPLRIDDRINAIIVFDIPDCIAKVKEEVLHWDTTEHQQMQVLIEAKLVEVTNEVSQQFGIRWGGSAAEGASVLPNNVSSDFSVNTPVTAVGAAAEIRGMGLRVGYADTVSVDLSLEALEAMGKTKKLSNPKVLTLDKQAASIVQGTTIYVPVTTAAGTTFQQIAASTNLNITPTIKRYSNVELTVTASRNTPGAPVAGNVAVDQNTVTTKALVKDGETLVLGGIFTKDETQSETGVPILSKIPLLGWLFKTKSVGESTRELLVFITPRIVK